MSLAFQRHPPLATAVPIARDVITAARHDRAGTIVINGRFLRQPQTGVQRYARQVVLHLDRHLITGRWQALLVTPRGKIPPLDLRRIEVRNSRLPGSAAWEQTILPLWAGRATINLCNTAPLVSRRTIVCIHDCNVFEAADAYSQAFRAYYRLLLPLLVRGNAQIATVSRYSAQRISHHLGVPLGRIHVLPNGYEHALAWKADCSTLRGALDVDQRPFVLLVGSIAKHKNAAVVLGLSERLERLGIRIKVVGATSSIFADTRLKHDRNIDWIGSVDDSDLALLLDRALCLAFPSKSEGFGLPVLEAMARGCPVVSSDRSSLPEVCGSAALFADPDDPSAWLERFAELTGSAALRTEMAAQGRERCRLFSWLRTAEGYMDMVARYE